MIVADVGVIKLEEKIRTEAMARLTSAFVAVYGQEAGERIAKGSVAEMQARVDTDAWKPSGR